MSEGFRLRVQYKITGRLAYLSHLETVRSMERVIRRAGLPFAITEGFNPHMKVAFGPALPVGSASNGEYLDVRLQEYLAPDDALAALQMAAPANLMPIACEYVESGADAIEVAYPVSVWHVEFFQDCVRLPELADAFTRLLALGYIEVVKKKGRKETVKRVEFEGRLMDPPVLSENDGCVSVRFVTRLDANGALRPDKFIDAALADISGQPDIKSLTRVELRHV